LISLPDREVIILDIETTEVALAETLGTFPEPVEIGAVRTDATFAPYETFTTLVKPTRLEHFTAFSEGLTGIKRAELETAPTFQECWRDFAKFTRFNGLKLITWGAPFDYAVLKLAYLKINLGYPHAYPMMDAISMVYRAAGEWGFKVPRWSLKQACERFGVPVEKKHRALGGAKACAAVLRAVANLGDEEDNAVTFT
jgi:DNA polymerase III epsilon subunit-like protein